MAGNSANEAFRQIRALYALGTAGGLTDAELVERFLVREGAEREDAFAALVQRHGPMVLRVCRRMLPGPADAEDAFQAVFLVLARKAGTIRRVEGLTSWLHGVAVRTAREARRRSARQRAREEAAMDRSRAGAEPADAGLGDLLPLLDEEIDRLPERYREPLMLCELEGMPRKEAARQLGLAEGTVSSRLSRGRSLLRDRLSRRGVALGAGAIAGLLSDGAGAALPEPLADATVRLALTFATAGTVPASVASLAEGVLKVMFVARLKVILVAAVAVAATSGLAWAVGPPHEGDLSVPEPPAPTVARTGAIAGSSDAGPQLEIRGVVVDEGRHPVAGVEVLANAFDRGELRAVTGADGFFAIPIRQGQPVGPALLARTADGLRAGGIYRQAGRPLATAGRPPVVITLKPTRVVAVRVIDASRVAVHGAVVTAAGNFSALDEGTTNADGSVTLRIPADGNVEWIVALKPGSGFDYAEFGPLDQYGRSQGGAKAAEIPASVALTLDGARTVRIKAVDGAGRPLAGVDLAPSWLQKEGRRSHINFESRHFVATTDRDGVATLDWLPRTKDELQFFPVSEGYAHRRVVVDDAEAGPVTATLSRVEAIRGRVAHADDTPAAGVEVVAHGTGRGVDNGQGRVRTDADGSYEMRLNADEAYAVYVQDKDWAAPSRLDVVLREGKPVDGVDFTLTRGTVIRGTVTVGGGRPSPKQYIRLIERADRYPAGLYEEGDQERRAVERQFGATTDGQGRYSIRVGPGTFKVIGPPRTGEETVTIKDEPELVRDYRMPRPENGPLSGRVVVGSESRGVAGASVEVFSTNLDAGVPFTVTADAEGRFHAERPLDRAFLCARSPDRSLAGLVEIGAEDPEATVVLGPIATATGVLLDTEGKPAANQKLHWGRQVFYEGLNGVSSLAFAPRVATDAEGRFTLPGLVVGQEYQVSLERNKVYHLATVARPEEPGLLDLGTIRAGAYRPRDVAHAEEEASSFRSDAPGAGKHAPPIAATTLDGRPLALADFQGKFVLLDFWATWCGPCIAEIPQLQAVHDAFGKDGRLAILSLSVDEDIKEPRTFQERRKLPWDQAFLGQGIHSAIPGSFGVEAIPAFVLVGPDGKIVARGMRGDGIMKAVAKALGSPAPALRVEK